MSEKFREFLKDNSPQLDEFTTSKPKERMVNYYKTSDILKNMKTSKQDGMVDWAKKLPKKPIVSNTEIDNIIPSYVSGGVVKALYQKLKPVKSEHIKESIESEKNNMDYRYLDKFTTGETEHITEAQEDKMKKELNAFLDSMIKFSQKAKKDLQIGKFDTASQAVGLAGRVTSEPFYKHFFK